MVFGGLVRRAFICLVVMLLSMEIQVSSSITPQWAADKHWGLTAGPYLQHLLAGVDLSGSHHVQLPCGACMYALLVPGSCAMLCWMAA